MTRRSDQHGHWRVSALAGWNSMKAPSVKLPLLHRGKAGEPPGIVAVARVDQRTKNITKRLSPGDIAIIDHSDLDRVSAEELIRRKVAAVINAAVSITGRYPNLGPKLLLEAGIPIVDGVGQDVLVKVTDGAVVRLDQETLYLGDAVVAKGTPLTTELVQTAMTEARAMVGVQIESFAANTLEFLRREHELLTRGIQPPEMDTAMDGRHVIVVVGTHHTLEEFLDKGRPGMSSTFITHLRVGSKLVNARGVHQLYHSRISGWSLLVLVLAAAVTVFVAVVFSPASPILARYFEATWHSFTYWLTGKL